MPKNSTGFSHKPRKRFGQNFLQDATVIDEILLASEVSKEDTVLEIGPGRGAITGLLAERAGKLVCVEIDWDLAGELKTRFFGQDNVTIIEGDILKLDLHKILGDSESLKVVANLPYYITTPILMGLLESGLKFQKIVVMVQKEVALRMCAKQDTSDYGALSLAVQFYTNPEIVTPVPASAFYPAPKVDSAVVALDYKDPPVEGQSAETFFKVVKAAFAQRRKTLTNALTSASIAEKGTIKEILLAMNKNENIRGEALSIDEFLELTEKIGEASNGN